MFFFQEKGYQAIRWLISNTMLSKHAGYEPVIKRGQALMSWLKIPSLYTNYSQYLTLLNINTRVFSLNYLSPITFAAFEGHLDSLVFWLNLGCGGGCLKTIKTSREVGNPQPRIQSLHFDQQEHLLNALGLPGPGVTQLIDQLKNHSIINADQPIGISIGGHCLDEYKQTINALVAEEGQLFKQLYYEVNISCPNTSTGKSIHDELNQLSQLINHIRSKSSRVIVIKVSPDASNQNLCEIAEIAKSHNEVTINAGNTQFKKCADLNLPNEAISIGGGGFSGPTLFKRTLEMAKLLAQFNLPLISTGGVSTVDQVKVLQENNVAVVGLATQLVKNPFSIVRLNNQLAQQI